MRVARNRRGAEGSSASRHKKIHHDLVYHIHATATTVSEGVPGVGCVKRQVLTLVQRGAQRLVSNTDTPNLKDLIWPAECNGRNTRPGLLHRLPRSWVNTELVCSRSRGGRKG